MRKILSLSILSLSLGFALNAKADDAAGAAEYFHQAGDGKWEAMVGIGLNPGMGFATTGAPNGYSSYSESARTGGGTFKETSLPIAVDVEYGINQMFAVGLDLVDGTGSSSFTGNPSVNISGLYDPQLYLKGNYAMGGGSLVYGAFLTLGIANGTIDNNGNPTNWSDGMTTLTPYVGYQMMAGPGTWGIRIMDDVYHGNGKTTGPGSTSITTSGGGGFGIDTFYEANMGGWSLGGAIDYKSYNATKDAVAGGTAVSNNDAMTSFGVQVYAPIAFSGWTLLPHVAYNSFSFSSSQSAGSSANAMELGAAARFTF